MFSRGISEIVLVVQDVEASTHFYRDVVGLNPRTRRRLGLVLGWAAGPYTVGGPEGGDAVVRGDVASAGR